MTYQGNLLSKTLVIGIILLLIVSVSPISGSNIMLSPIDSPNIMLLERDDCPINITVHEAWELLNDTSNGIQIPIDIRSEEDWNESHIDTPFPENPIWYGDIDDFMVEFDGEEVMIYCKGGYQSLLLCYVICDAGFNGTVYNMIGGFTAWKEAGYPITNNTPPDTPVIEGKRRFKEGEGGKYPYTIYSTDPEGDAITYLINWSDGTTVWTDFYESGEEFTYNVTIPLDEGTYIIFKIKAKDIFGAESNWTTLEVTVPRNRATVYSLFQLLFERFPFLEVIILRAMNLLR